MAQSRAIIDKLLSNASSGYFPKGFICEQVLPSVGVINTTGKLGKYGTGHLRIENTVVGGEGKYRRVKSQARTTDTYEIEGHGLEGVVTMEDYKNVEQPFDAEKDETLGLSTILWLEKEKALADQLGNTAVLTQNVTLTGTDQYNDWLNSDPLDDFSTAMATVKAGCGLPPDTAIMSWEVANKLRYHPALLDAMGFKFAKPGGLVDADLAVALNVQRVLIGSASYESANEGQTSSLSAVWGKNIIFAVCPTVAQQQQVSLGYLVKYSDKTPRQVYKEAQFNPPGSNAILVEDHYDMLLSNVLAAYLIKNAIA